MKTNIYLQTLVVIAFYGHLQSQPKKTPELLDPSSTSEKEKKSTITSAKSIEENFNLHNNLDSLSKLHLKSEELSLIVQKIRNNATGEKKASIKKTLLAESNVVEKQWQVLQIAASNLASRINMYQFDKNRTRIRHYVALDGEQNVPVFTKFLIFDSEKLMRSAKEMREEANAQPKLAARLGNMSNAEEKEELALRKQLQAVMYLERTSHYAISASR